MYIDFSKKWLYQAFRVLKDDGRICVNVPYEINLKDRGGRVFMVAEVWKIMEELKWDFNVAYDEKDAVGRRYRRQDALGTPFCITVDHQTLEDQTVTIRHRDSMKQDRLAISELKTIIDDEVSMKNWLMKAN